MKCKKCGAELKEGVAFCRECGAKVEDEEAFSSNDEYRLENESNLYMYAFSTDEIILKIPSGTKVSYDYSVSEPRIIYYHVNYNNHSGWIIVYS